MWPHYLYFSKDKTCHLRVSPDVTFYLPSWTILFWLAVDMGWVVIFNVVTIQDMKYPPLCRRFPVYLKRNRVASYSTLRGMVQTSGNTLLGAVQIQIKANFTQEKARDQYYYDVTNKEHENVNWIKMVQWHILGEILINFWFLLQEEIIWEVEQLLDVHSQLLDSFYL